MKPVYACSIEPIIDFDICAAIGSLPMEKAEFRSEILAANKSNNPKNNLKTSI